MKSPTSIKLYQGKGFLVCTQPCGISPLPPPSLACLKLLARICPVEQQDHCMGPGDWITQMSKVNSTDLKHNKNTENTHILYKFLQRQCQVRKCVYESKTDPRSKKQVNWLGKVLLFLHFLQCHDPLWFGDLCLSFLNCILYKYSYHWEQPDHLGTCYRQAILEVVDQHTRPSIQKPPPVCSALLRIITRALGSSGSISSCPLSHLIHENLVHIQSLHLELETGSLSVTSQVQIVFFHLSPQCHSLTVITHSHPNSLRNYKLRNQRRQGRLQ